jgi:hypothetical protein
MIITVRCFLIPADITFDTRDVTVRYNMEDNYAVAIFNAESEDPVKVCIEKQHYLDEKNKK